MSLFTRIKPTLKSFIRAPKTVNFQYLRTSTTTSAPNTEYVTVYKFPYIRPISIINQLKIYQTVLTGLSVPSAFILNQLNYISFDVFQYICALGLSGCLTLYGLGYIPTKFIGFLYYNEQKDCVKVAYVDFWGKRKEIEIPANDIIPIDELPYSVTDSLYLKFRRRSTKDSFKLNLKYGIIVEKNLINKIL